MASRTGRAVRILAAQSALVLVLAGTRCAGDDDNPLTIKVQNPNASISASTTEADCVAPATRVYAARVEDPSKHDYLGCMLMELHSKAK